MDLTSRKQYMDQLRTKYRYSSKKGKGVILDEYCRNTGQDRKYAIKRFRQTVRLKEVRQKRDEVYDGAVKTALAKMWEIFDYPCGSRMQTILRDETERMRQFKELECSDEVTQKLIRMGSATIDRKLKHQKEVLRFEARYPKRRLSFNQQVPVKTSAEFDRQIIGHTEVDFVESCGTSASGDYVNNLSLTDVATGWWEGEAVMGKSQRFALEATERIRQRLPFQLVGLHPDNGSNLLNHHFIDYAKEHQIEFTRSRPYQKNDNCFVEQKNSTHVRQVIGYLRYDTTAEQNIINDLYRHELGWFKNFFQPTIKLIAKERIKGKIHRKYGKPQTPYQRLMESTAVSTLKKVRLKQLHDQLNPAQLKREIDCKLDTLNKTYVRKMGSKSIATTKRLSVSMVSNYMMQPA
jgi:hypothetical protein